MWKILIYDQFHAKDQLQSVLVEELQQFKMTSIISYSSLTQLLLQQN